MEQEQLIKIVEALLFVSTKPLTEEKILEIVNEGSNNSITSKEQIEKIMEELNKKYTDEVFAWQLIKAAGGYQFVTKKTFSPWIKKMYKSKFTIRLSPSALETLSIIAYKQPLTKADVEQIRGVDSTGVLATLLSRKLIKISGHKEAPGNPVLYTTTQEFLRYFGLNSINDLPLPEHIEIPEEELEEIEKQVKNEDSPKEDVVIVENS